MREDSVEALNAKIVEAIEVGIGGERERIIKEAVAEFEKLVRASVANVAMKASQVYSIQRMGPEIVIHVQIGSRE